MDSNLILKQMEVGPMANFIYFLGDKRTKEVAVVDPAWDVDFLRSEAEKLGCKISKVFLTHGHPDHVNGLKELQSTHDIPVYISKHEADFYTPKCKNLNTVEDKDKLSIGGIEFTCILTPGHTPGCQCFLYQDVLITGDALFVDGCGRCDLPGGNAKTMYHSLYDIILKLPENLTIYPGHNYGAVPFATLAKLKRTNHYLQCHNLQEFLSERMGLAA